MKWIIPVLIIGLIFISGCSQSVDVSFLAKEIPQVNDYLKEHPDAEVEVLLWTNDYVKENIDKIPEECLDSINTSEHYIRATYEENGEQYVSFIEFESREVVCVVNEEYGRIDNPNETIKIDDLANDTNSSK